MKRAVLLLALVLAGCGGSGREQGTATLWVTRDRGAHVIFSGSVPAGSDGIRTVERKLKVTTRYGGRYLQSLDGIAGSLSKQQDWFFYVNGIEGQQSAVDVKIHPGDVLWWDYRSWSATTMDIPVVVGAYPQPFISSPTSVVSSDRALAARIAKQVKGVVDAKRPLRNYIVIGSALEPDALRIKPFRNGFELDLGIDAARKLASDPSYLRYRFA